jgi:hypothetical protein
MRPGPESTLNAAFELTPQAALLSWRTCLRRGPPVPGWKALGLAPPALAVVRPVSRADLAGRLKRRKIAPA